MIERMIYYYCALLKISARRFLLQAHNKPHLVFADKKIDDNNNMKKPIVTTLVCNLRHVLR